MLVGRVTGNVVSTNKVDTLHGAKLLIVQPVELDTLAMIDDYVADSYTHNRAHQTKAKLVCPKVL